MYCYIPMYISKCYIFSVNSEQERLGEVLGRAVLQSQRNKLGYYHLTSLWLNFIVICLDYISCEVTDFTGFSKDAWRKNADLPLQLPTKVTACTTEQSNLAIQLALHEFLFDTYWWITLNINNATYLLIEINRTYGSLLLSACLNLMRYR